MCELRPRAEILLPTDLASPAAARRFTRENACLVHAPHSLDDAVLLVSELVTNAVVHGAPPIVLVLECGEGGLRIAVRDGSPAVPQARSLTTVSEGGRGLPLVALLTSVWGVEPTSDENSGGKQVWVELSRSVGL